MQIVQGSFDFGSNEYDDLVLPVHEKNDGGAQTPSGLSFEGIEARQLDDFPARSGATSLIYPQQDVPCRRVMLLGLGPADKVTQETFRNAVAAAVSACRDARLTRVAIAAPSIDGLESARVLTETAVGAGLGVYAYNSLLSEPKKETALEMVAVLSNLEDDLDNSRQEEALRKGRAAAAGVSSARDFINTPSNIKTPTYMAEQALDLVERHGFDVRILDADDIIELGMGCYASVFQGSHKPAKLVILDTDPQSKEQPLAFVGKGVTFDSGGVSLKPSKGMETMKGDMGGAAAVLGFFEAYGRIGAGRRVVGLLPFAENMPDAHATRPGDVVTSYTGKTVEIINTDAEGRLLLCDVLAYAETYNPSAIVDLATLTGACIVALGTKVAGLFAEDETMLNAVRAAADLADEKMWPLPAWDMFADDLKSDTADLKNVGDRRGGALHAAVFLKQFVPTDVPWAHIDIAGPSWVESPEASQAKGGAGYGVRTLLELALDPDFFPADKGA